MKFSDFLKEAKDVADLNAKRLGWVDNGHGDYYDKDTAEFVAKKKDGKLKLYNQKQKPGKDPNKIDLSLNVVFQHLHKLKTTSSLEMNM